MPQVGDRHGQQGHRDALARGEQHVQLAAERQRADLLGQVDQLVGGVAHRRDGDHDVVTGLAGATIRWATVLMRSASLTEDPPYFWTTSATGSPVIRERSRSKAEFTGARRRARQVRIVDR